MFKFAQLSSVLRYQRCMIKCIWCTNKHFTLVRMLWHGYSSIFRYIYKSIANTVGAIATFISCVVADLSIKFKKWVVKNFGSGQNFKGMFLIKYLRCWYHISFFFLIRVRISSKLSIKT